ncbi:MAG: BamA/TamA family outer membrane protein [Planctomycetota bacterium]|nr:BamA/TamA family outer membrane protein [Planctomycetota bacterium]
MKGPALLLRWFVAAAPLALAACRSSAPAAEPAVEPVATGPSEAGQPPDERALLVEGAPSSEESDLERAIAPLAESYARSGKRSYVDDAAYEARLHLRSRGYAGAAVSYEILDAGLARLTVRAGPRSILGAVTVAVEGRSPISEDDLARYVTGPRTGLFGRGPTLYVARRVASAADAIQEDLIALGHLDATARIIDPGPGPAGEPVEVRVEVDPGPLYRVGEVTFALARTAAGLSDETAAAALAALADVVGQSGEERGFRPRMVSRLRGAIIDALGQRGHPDASAEISVDVDRRTRRVDLAVTADPGPYVVLGEVRVQGEVRTRASFLASRMRIRRGEVYDSSKLRESLRALYRTGLFRQVTATLEGDGEMRSVRVDVIERPSVEVYAEPGFGSYELGRLTVGARDRNLMGRGIDANAEATVAVRAVRANLSLSDPWFLSRDLIGDLRADFAQREEPSFTRQRRGVGAFVGKEWSARHATSLGYRFGRSSATDVEAVDEDVLDVQSRVNVAGLIATQRYDARDALFAPTRGGFAEASLEFALEELGSQLEFVRSRLSTAYFRALSEEDVLGVGLRMGVIAPAFDDTTIPLQERFFAGGENSVRSFRESRLGPSDANGEPLGGEAFGTLSLEWRHELGGAFQSALFADAGYVEAQAEDLFAFDDVRTGVGVGLRYLLPIGPVRLDAAFNPDRRPGEAEWVVHFAIGMPF